MYLFIIVATYNIHGFPFKTVQRDNTQRNLHHHRQRIPPPSSPKHSSEEKNISLQLAKFPDSAIAAKLRYKPLNRRHHKSQVAMHMSMWAVDRKNISHILDGYLEDLDR